MNQDSLMRNARSLRRNMTAAERKLWYQFLRDLPVHFWRQHVLGKYIVDFYCHSRKLVIELDGSQHYEDAGRAADTARDAWLLSQGLTVLRYSNADVKQRFPGVCEDILKHLELETEPGR